MLGVVALTGIGLLLLGLRFVPRPGIASSAGASQGWMSAAPSAAPAPTVSGFEEDPTNTLVYQPANCDSSACDEAVEIKAVTHGGGSAGTASSPTVAVVAHVRLYSGHGSFDYTPAVFTFHASNHRQYSPVTTEAFGPSLVPGHLDHGMTASGILVFEVPVGGGAIEIDDNHTVYDWAVPSS